VKVGAGDQACRAAADDYAIIFAMSHGHFCVGSAAGQDIRTDVLLPRA